MDKTIKKDYMWNTLGVLLQNALSPLLLIVVAQINNSFDVGLFSFAFSVSIIFWAISMWGGRTYQVSDIHQKFSNTSYVFVRVILGAVVLIGAVLFCVGNGYDVYKTFLLILLTIYKIIESVVDSLYGILQVRGRLYIVGISLVLKAILSLAAFLICDLLTKNIVYSTACMIIPLVVTVLMYDIPQLKHIGIGRPKDINWRQARRQSYEILLVCAPVFIASFLAMFSLNIPRYFIDTYHASQNVYFGIMAMPITLVLLLMTFILQPNIVRISKFLDKGSFTDAEKIIKIIIITTGAIGCFVLLGTWLVGVEALKLVFGIDFLENKINLMVMVMGGVVNAGVAVFINLLTILRSFREQVIIQVATNGLLILASIITIPTGGLTVSIWLFFATTVVQYISLLVVWRKRIKYFRCGTIVKR